MGGVGLGGGLLPRVKAYKHGLRPSLRGMPARGFKYRVASVCDERAPEHVGYGRVLFRSIAQRIIVAMPRRFRVAEDETRRILAY